MIQTKQISWWQAFVTFIHSHKCVYIHFSVHRSPIACQAIGPNAYIQSISQLAQVHIYASKPFIHFLAFMQYIIPFHFQGLFDTIRTPTTNLPLSDHYGVRAELFVTFRRRVIQRLCPTSSTLGRVVPFLNMEDIEQCTQDFCPAEATP